MVAECGLKLQRQVQGTIRERSFRSAVLEAGPRNQEGPARAARGGSATQSCRAEAGRTDLNDRHRVSIYGGGLSGHAYRNPTHWYCLGANDP